MKKTIFALIVLSIAFSTGADVYMNISSTSILQFSLPRNQAGTVRLLNFEEKAIYDCRLKNGTINQIDNDANLQLDRYPDNKFIINTASRSCAGHVILHIEASVALRDLTISCTTLKSDGGIYDVARNQQKTSDRHLRRIQTFITHKEGRGYTASFHNDPNTKNMLNIIMETAIKHRIWLKQHYDITTGEIANMHASLARIERALSSPYVVEGTMDNSELLTGYQLVEPEASLNSEQRTTEQGDEECLEDDAYLQPHITTAKLVLKKLRRKVADITLSNKRRSPREKQKRFTETAQKAIAELKRQLPETGPYHNRQQDLSNIIQAIEDYCANSALFNAALQDNNLESVINRQISTKGG